MIDVENRASLAVATRAGFQPIDEVGPNRLLGRTIPPLVYGDGVVTIRPRRSDDLQTDIEAKDVEQQQWLWLPEHRALWTRLTATERRTHSEAVLLANVEEFGRGPKWTFSVDGPWQQNLAYVDVDLANDHAPMGEANISYATHPAHRGRGYARRAVSLVTRFLAEHTGARNAYLSVAVDNVASQRVVDAVGGIALDSWTDSEGRVTIRRRLPIVR